MSENPYDLRMAELSELLDSFGLKRFRAGSYSPPKALATIAHDAGKVPKTHVEVLIAELLAEKVLGR